MNIDVHYMLQVLKISMKSLGKVSQFEISDVYNKDKTIVHTDIAFLTGGNILPYYVDITGAI